MVDNLSGKALRNLVRDKTTSNTIFTFVEKRTYENTAMVGCGDLATLTCPFPPTKHESAHQ
jgi:hypothetical protein